MARIDLRNFFKFLLFMSFICLSTACGTRQIEDQKADRTPIRVAWPEADIETDGDGVLQAIELESASFIGTPKTRSIFWLDFEGASVTSQDSFIVRNTGLDRVNIPSFKPSDIGQNTSRSKLKLEIAQEVLDLFSGVNIELTLTKPQDQEFSRVHIGGSNFTGRPSVLGIAPLDIGNRSARDVLFCFSSELADKDPEVARKELSHVIAHEMAHSLGAQHIENEFSFMNPFVTNDANSFDHTGPVVGRPGVFENSLEIMKNSSSSKNRASKGNRLPEIITLGAFSRGDQIHYTVLVQENFAENPGLRLSDFDYAWSYKGKTVDGTSIVMVIDDREEHSLQLTISNAEAVTKVYQFVVGRGI